jgi:hypothetical protein
MGYEVINRLRGPSTIRVVDSTATLNLSDLSTNTSVETVIAATITSLKWSLHPTNGNLQITRGGVLVANVFQTGFWSHDELNIANTSNANIVMTITGTGTAIVSVAKQVTLNVDAQQI